VKYGRIIKSEVLTLIPHVLLVIHLYVRNRDITGEGPNIDPLLYTSQYVIEIVPNQDWIVILIIIL